MARSKKATVEDFLAELPHPRKVEIEELRAAILGADQAIGEQVKWNAPSFGVDGDDGITFRLQPGDRVGLIFHRGVAKRSDTDSFSFADPSGLIQWSTDDRGVVAFRDHADVRRHKPAVVELVDAWIRATSE